jgi:hypothetical protein
MADSYPTELEFDGDRVSKFIRELYFWVIFCNFT